MWDAVEECIVVLLLRSSCMIQINSCYCQKCWDLTRKLKLSEQLGASAARGNVLCTPQNRNNSILLGRQNNKERSEIKNKIQKIRSLKCLDAKINTNVDWDQIKSLTQFNKKLMLNHTMAGFIMKKSFKIFYMLAFNIFLYETYT